MAAPAGAASSAAPLVQLRVAASHAESRWLLRHWAPAQLRRGPPSAALTEAEGALLVAGLSPKERERYRKSAATLLKKLAVEDLGDWDAAELLTTIKESRWGPNSVEGEPRRLLNGRDY